MLLQERETVVLTVDEFLKIDIVDYSKIRIINPLKPESGRPIDLGAICYWERQLKNTISQNDMNRATLVNLNSIRKDRYKFIAGLVDEFSKKSPTTIVTNLNEFFLIFDWLDLNGFQNFLENTATCHLAYLEFTNHLIERTKCKDHKNKINARVAKDKQWIFRKIINTTFPNKLDIVIGGVITLKGKSEVKIPISNDYLHEYWELNLELFTKLSKQCFSNKAFPPNIKTTKINSYYIPFFPRNVPIITPYISNKERIPAFDYKLGLFVDELKDCKKRSTLEIIKSNPKHYHRLKLAMFALHAFIQVFRILTRVNNAELIKLEYSDDFEKERSKTSQSFYTIKCRAKNRKIELNIQKNGYKLFKEYLRLRNWILNEKKCKFLFFSLGHNNLEEPKQLSRQINYLHHRELLRKKLLPNKSLPIKDQELRNANTIFLRDLGYPSKSVAENNNHSVAVSESIYSVPSLEKQKNEIKNFFDALKKTKPYTNLDTKKMRKKKINPTTVGSCSNNVSDPKPFIQNPTIIPDCKTPQGCLFCEHYVCHAEKEDLRKLLSLLLVTKTIIDTAIDFEFAYEKYSFLILRIEWIISKISKISKDKEILVNSLKEEVLSNGNITKFWDKRFDYYEKLGLIKS